MAPASWAATWPVAADVYKRQGQGTYLLVSTTSGLSDPELFLTLMAGDGLDDGLGAVSYTHLDVYKRQATSCGMTPAVCM